MRKSLEKQYCEVASKLVKNEKAKDNCEAQYQKILKMEAQLEKARQKYLDIKIKQETTSFKAEESYLELGKRIKEISQDSLPACSASEDYNSSDSDIWENLRKVTGVELIA